MLVVASNGDENAFSCWKSPSSSESVLSVGGVSLATDTQLLESNYGDCVDILAPGENIFAPYLGNTNRESKSLSGTSAAAAIVTGIATRLIGFIERNDTIKDSLMAAHHQTTISQFLRAALSSSRYTATNQTDTVHPNSYLLCDIAVFDSMDEIYSKELKLTTKKKVIPALTRARKAFLELQNQQKAAMFA
jgi:subtilisin family serine protease